LKKVLLLTKDVKHWFDTFKDDEAFGRLRRIHRRSDKDVTLSSDLLEVRILDSFWRDNLRGYKYDVVILDMAMEMDDWEMFKINAKEIRFGERANYLLGGKKVAPLYGSLGLIEAEKGKLKGTITSKDGKGIQVWDSKNDCWKIEKEIEWKL
jgi:hypothetical protein